MARLNKLEQARQDGIDYAYRIVKEEGIEALEKRVTRNRKTNVPAFVNQAQADEFAISVKENVVVTMLVVMQIVLKDKFGFGQKRLMRFKEHFESYCESLSGGWCTYTDIEQTLHDELGVEVVDGEKEKEFLAKMDKGLAEQRKQIKGRGVEK